MAVSAAVRHLSQPKLPSSAVGGSVGSGVHSNSDVPLLPPLFPSQLLPFQQKLQTHLPDCLGKDSTVGKDTLKQSLLLNALAAKCACFKQNYAEICINLS